MSKKEYFDRTLKELEYATKLKLLACSEAALRIDFENRRIKGKKRDKIAKKFKEISKTKKSPRIKLEEDILDIWKEDTRYKASISLYKGVLRYRHWLAHGRAWSPKLAEDYTLIRVLDIIISLFETLPNFDWIIGDEFDYPVKSI